MADRDVTLVYHNTRELLHTESVHEGSALAQEQVIDVEAAAVQGFVLLTQIQNCGACAGTCPAMDEHFHTSSSSSVRSLRARKNFFASVGGPPS